MELVDITVMYYQKDNPSLELKWDFLRLPRCKENGRVLIPDFYKKDKIIVAVCKGRIEILNKMGDRAVDLHERHKQALSG